MLIAITWASPTAGSPPHTASGPFEVATWCVMMTTEGVIYADMRHFFVRKEAIPIVGKKETECVTDFEPMWQLLVHRGYHWVLCASPCEDHEVSRPSQHSPPEWRHLTMYPLDRQDAGSVVRRLDLKVLRGIPGPRPLRNHPDDPEGRSHTGLEEDVAIDEVDPASIPCSLLLTDAHPRTRDDAPGSETIISSMSCSVVNRAPASGTGGSPTFQTECRIGMDPKIGGGDSSRKSRRNPFFPCPPTNPPASFPSA